MPKLFCFNRSLACPYFAPSAVSSSPSFGLWHLLFDGGEGKVGRWCNVNRLRTRGRKGGREGGREGSPPPPAYIRVLTHQDIILHISIPPPANFNMVYTLGRLVILYGASSQEGSVWKQTRSRSPAIPPSGLFYPPPPPSTAEEATTRNAPSLFPQPQSTALLLLSSPISNNSYFLTRQKSLLGVRRRHRRLHCVLSQRYNPRAAMKNYCTATVLLHSELPSNPLQPSWLQFLLFLLYVDCFGFFSTRPCHQKRREFTAAQSLGIAQRSKKHVNFRKVS